uniref:Facilitated trehalose transporter Tret1-like isoform X1 n=2 Tax=Diabrotica virgifera virgifera TaxID=50390 RepID=A0A6P7G2L7_DIAVI
MGIQKYSGSAFYQYVAGFSATIATLVSGMHYGWPAPSLPRLLDGTSYIHINEDIGYWLAIAPLLGTLVGSPTTPLFIDRIGRHKTILLTGLPYVLSWVLIYFASRYELILAGRLLAGVADGWMFCSVPVYIGEIAEPRIRGFLGSLISVSYIGGILLIDIIGSFCTVPVTALISTVFPIAMVVIFFFMPESPYFLVMKGDNEAAKKELQILRGTNNVEKEIARIQEGIQEEQSVKSNPLDLFRIASNRKAVIIILAIRICQEFSGDSAITFYTQNIFREAGTDIPEDIASIILFVIELIVTIVAALLADRFGRRPLLIFSAAGAAISLLVEGVYFYLKICTDLDLSDFNLVPLVALISFVVCLGSGLKVIPLLMLSELFPASVKGASVAVADLSSAGLVMLVSKYFQFTRDHFGMYVPFISFAVFCTIGLLYITLCVPETKGKTLEEIQDHLKGIKKIDKNNIESQLSTVHKSVHM